MRRTLVFAALAVAAAAPLLSTPASACDPYRPPWCQNACTIARSGYTTVHDTVGRGPSWYNLDLGVCGT